jgi:hypothetical protein
MKMAVDTRDNGVSGMLSKFFDRLCHLLMTLTGIDGDNAFGAADKCLIRQAITDITPGCVSHSIKRFR